jgi:hypothetical protein
MPGKTSSIENIVFAVILLAILSFTVGPIIWGHFRRGDVLKNGVDGKAKVVEITDTGRRHNTNPVVRIKLNVTDASGNDFPAEVTMPLSPVRLSQHRVGDTVPVKYDPKSRDRVAIVFPAQ